MICLALSILFPKGTADVMPYVHCLEMVFPSFLNLHGYIMQCTKQGLEKRNYLSTIHFPHF